MDGVGSAQRRLASLGSDDGLPAPALVLDLAAMEANIATMAARAAAAGIRLRPHAKAHKCPEIARRLVAAGAAGASCAVLAEAEAMAAAGIGGLLVTSPVVGAAAADRVHRLLLRGADLAVVADDPATLPPLAAAARAAGRSLPVLVEVDVGQARTGVGGPDEAVALARAIAACEGLHYAGVQGYWGHLQQVMPFAERRARVAAQAARLAEVIAALHAADLPATLVTGGGTGTAMIDLDMRLLTEIQPGSYLFLDSAYGAVTLDGGEVPGAPFRPTLFVSAQVVSAQRPGRAIVNAGLKAFAADSGRPLPVLGAPPGATYRFMGDEHGAVDFDPAQGTLRTGDRVEFLTSHCDPTVNLHSVFHVRVEGRIQDIWPITARY